MAVIEAVIGLGLVALLITYLPSIYAAFQRRELQLLALRRYCYTTRDESYCIRSELSTMDMVGPDVATNAWRTAWGNSLSGRNGADVLQQIAANARMNFVSICLVWLHYYVPRIIPVPGPIVYQDRFGQAVYPTRGCRIANAVPLGGSRSLEEKVAAGERLLLADAAAAGAP